MSRSKFMISSVLLLLISSVAISTSPSTLHAQPDSCGDVVTAALETAGQICDATGRNQACYGNFNAEAEPRPNAPNFTFAQIGDIVDVSNVQTVRVNGLNEATGEWGVVLMRLQANIPDTLPGQNVTFVLFGDTEITNAVSPDDVSSESDMLRPMQAFYLNTGIGGTSCEQAPDSGLLVQTPEGVGEISLRVNEVNIMLGSTVFFQILDEEDGTDMRVSALEGAAFVEVDGRLQVAVAGTWLRVPVERDGSRVRAIAQPGPPIAYKEDVMSRLPVQLLQRRIDVATPLTDEQVAIVRERIASGEPLCDTAFFPACDTLPPAFRDGLNCLPSDDDDATDTARPCRIAPGIADIGRSFPPSDNGPGIRGFGHRGEDIIGDDRPCVFRPRPGDPPLPESETRPFCPDPLPADDRPCVFRPRPGDPPLPESETRPFCPDPPPPGNGD